MERFDRSFNNGFCWVIQSDRDNYINVAMIQKYYEDIADLFCSEMVTTIISTWNLTA